MLFLADFSVIKPDFGLLFWTTIIFLLFWLIIGRFAFGPIARALRKREDDIQHALDEAERARAEMQNLKAENEQILVEAREERSKIIKEAKETKESIIKDAKDKAKEEAKRIVADASREIENQKSKALVEVKNQLGMMALGIAEKVLRKELKGDDAQEKFVNNLVDEIKLN